MLKFCSIWRVRRLRRIIASQRCDVRPGITHIVEVQDMFIDYWQTCVTMHMCTKCGKYWY